MIAQAFVSQSRSGHRRRGLRKGPIHSGRATRDPRERTGHDAVSEHPHSEKQKGRVSPARVSRSRAVSTASRWRLRDTSTRSRRAASSAVAAMPFLIFVAISKTSATAFDRSEPRLPLGAWLLSPDRSRSPPQRVSAEAPRPPSRRSRARCVADSKRAWPPAWVWRDNKCVNRHSMYVSEACTAIYYQQVTH